MSDSIEKVKADAVKNHYEYFYCEKYKCENCPVEIDAKKPYEHYNVRGCAAAMRLDIIKRTEKLLGGEAEMNVGIERIKADAVMKPFGYWGCEKHECEDCPVEINGKKPYERYDVPRFRGCGKAMRLDIVYRMEKLLGGEQ